MKTALQLPEWSTLAGTADTSMPLFACALLIARDEYPALDIARCDAALQTHAHHLRIEVDAIGPTPLKMLAINRHLFEEIATPATTTPTTTPATATSTG